MSIKLMSAIFDNETLGPTERLVMLALAHHVDHDDDSGRCYPSIQRLRQRTGLSERAIQNNIKKLISEGYVTIVSGGGRTRSNVYFVSANPASRSVNPAPDAPNADINPALETPYYVRNPAPRSINPASRSINPAPDAPDPSITSLEPIGGGGSQARDPEFRTRLLGAMGIGPDGVVGPSRFVGGYGDMAEAGRWLELPGMTEAAILAEIAGIVASKRDGPPKSFSYFTTAMQRLSGRLTAPRLQPIEGTLNDKSTRLIPASAASRSEDRPDAALEQIARLAGIGQAPRGHCG